MTKLRWKGQMNGNQYTLGSNWEAWRNVENDGSVTVVFVSDNTVVQTIAPSKAESSKWVHRQLNFIQRLNFVHRVQADETHDLKMKWGRNRIRVNYVLHPDALDVDDCIMGNVAQALRQCADSLQPIDLGVVKYVEYDDQFQPLFLVGQKGKTYIMPLSPFAPAGRMRAAVHQFHVEGLKRVHRPN